MSLSGFSGSWSNLPNGREVTILELRCPITHQKKNGRKYTDFEISLKSNSKAFSIPRSSVRRRYSDFVWLRNWLQQNNEGFSSQRKTPSLPPKKVLGRFEDEFIEHRMKGLQRFLRKVIEHNVFLSDKALHLFLQSSMSVKQIESYLTGEPVNFDSNACIPHELIHEDLGISNDGTEDNKNGVKSNDCSLLQGIDEDLSHSDTCPENVASTTSQFAYESFETLPQDVNKVNSPLLSICAPPESWEENDLSNSEERCSSCFSFVSLDEPLQNMTSTESSNKEDAENKEGVENKETHTHDVENLVEKEPSSNPLEITDKNSISSKSEEHLSSENFQERVLEDCRVDVHRTHSTSDKCDVDHST